MQKSESVFAKNRKASFDYEILKTYEAGIVLRGDEVKSIRAGSVQLRDTYARFINNELWILNMHVSQYKYVSGSVNIAEDDVRRNRKLLLKKQELKKLNRASQEKGLTLLILKLYLKNRRIKAGLGLCRGKKLYDKRESSKQKDMLREMSRLEKKYR